MRRMCITMGGNGIPVPCHISSWIQVWLYPCAFARISRRMTDSFRRTVSDWTIFFMSMDFTFLKIYYLLFWILNFNLALSLWNSHISVLYLDEISWMCALSGVMENFECYSTRPKTTRRLELHEYHDRYWLPCWLGWLCGAPNARIWFPRLPYHRDGLWSPWRRGPSRTSFAI